MRRIFLYATYLVAAFEHGAATGSAAMARETPWAAVARGMPDMTTTPKDKKDKSDKDKTGKETEKPA